MLDRLAKLLRSSAGAAGKPLTPLILRTPAAAQDWKNRGNSDFAAGKLDAAAKCYREAINAAPDYAEAYNNLARVLIEQNRSDEAEQHLNRAIALKPDLANAYFNLGNLHQALGRSDPALVAYRQAIALDPAFSAAHNRLGMALSHLGQHEEAVACFQVAAGLDPASVEAHYNLGDALLECGRPAEARAPTETAIRLAPRFPLAHHNRGKVFLEMNALDEARACFEQTIALDPHYSAAHQSLGVVLHRQERIEEAIECYRLARTALPDDHSLLRNLGLALLAHGRLAEGWDCYEHRFLAGTTPRTFGAAEWHGEALANKSLLIWGEQGIGDEILYANCYLDAIAMAGRCVIECAPKLVPLFALSFPAAQVVPRSQTPHPATTHVDFHCAAGMLAKWLRTTIDNFPSRRAYLTPSADRVAFWRHRLAALGPGPKIGFSWRSHNLTGVRPLYYSKLDQWGPIFAVPGMHFISLQYDRCADELNAARGRFGLPLHVFDEVDLFDDLAEAAALTKALDLVVSAPTATAFLSASLGAPTMMMTYTTPWQTMGTNRIPWFPTMRCFSRRWDQAWDGVIDEISRTLAGYSSSGNV